MDLQHQKPAWSDKADFVIAADIKNTPWGSEYLYEQLAAKSIGDNAYVVCAIPFATPDICLGDEVALDEKYTIKSVIKKSEYVGFRVATKNMKSQEELINQLKTLINELYHEHFSESLLAVAVHGSEDAQLTADVLQKAEDLHTIVEYETVAT